MAGEIRYKILFSVKVLHNYYLDKGEDKYTSMQEKDKQEQLLSYNLCDFATIQPTIQTQSVLNGHRLLFKNSPTGFYIGVQASPDENNTPVIPLRSDLSLVFLLKINNPLFFNYTLINDDIVKEIIYFSNNVLYDNSNSPKIDVNKTIPRSGSAEEVIDFSDFELPETIFTADEEDLSKEEFEIRSEIEQLSIGVKNDLLGVIKIFMKSNASKDILDSSGNIPDNPVDFTICFNNRETFWKYIFEETQDVGTENQIFEPDSSDPNAIVTKVKYPLTNTGFISLKLNDKSLPNPGPEMIFPVDSDRIYSKIYV